ncbi:MAG: hypothetical protein Q9220_007731 [cf. Caloplaca sp. 1 TL-2023]
MAYPHPKTGVSSEQSARDGLAASSNSFEQGLRNMILGNKSPASDVLEPEVMLSGGMPQSVDSAPLPADSRTPTTNLRVNPTENEVNSRTQGKQHPYGRHNHTAREQQALLKDAGASLDTIAGERLPFSIKSARQPKRRQNVREGQSSASIPNSKTELSVSPPITQYRNIPEAKQPYQLDPVKMAQGTWRMHAEHVDHLKPSNGLSDRRSPKPKPVHSPHTSQPQAHLPPFYGRPPPQHRQLYNPHTNNSQSHHHTGSQGSFHQQQIPFQAFAQGQIKYLDTMLEREFAKAVISPEEEHQKESLRQVLEDLCQRAVTGYEIAKDVLFDGSTVTLKCFGSLRSGFATQSSDMDLAFESPLSKPDVSSPKSEIPRLLEKTLLDLGHGARLLTKTRVPILRFCETPTPELRDRLRAERLKWEKEGDPPPRAKKVKQPKPEERRQKTARKKKRDVEDTAKVQPAPDEKKHLVTDSDGAREKLVQEDPLSLDGEDLEAEESSSDSTSSHSQADGALANKNQHQTLENAKTGVNDVTKADLDPTCAGDVRPEHSPLHNSEGMSDETNESNRHTVAPEQSVTAVQGTAKETSPKVDAAPKERLEKSLPDEEIIRLYGLAMEEGWFESHERNIIFSFCKMVKHGSSEQVAECRLRLLDLPDVLNRYRPPPEHRLDFPKEGVGIQCDINFSNRLALHNSAMLKCYNVSDPRVKPMVLFVKAWTKRRKINSPYHGTLSSYGYVLMVLHYLVNVAQPPICLNLQTVPMAAQDTSVENSQLLDGHNVRFWRDEGAIQQWARQGDITQDRQSSVGSLLRGFFQYYAIVSGGFSWGSEVLSLRTPGGILSKKEKDWVAAKTIVLDPTVEGQPGQEVRQRYLFAIEDPFETEHNIARTVVHNGIVAIRDEFRRAHRLIREAGNGKMTEDLFEEAKAKDDLNHRHFGPRFGSAPGQKAATPKEKVEEGDCSKTMAKQAPESPSSARPKVSAVNETVSDGRDHVKATVLRL